MIRKSDLMLVFGSHSAIGRAFAPANGGEPITRSAVGQWEEEIPELREFQVRKLYPDIDERIEKAKLARAQPPAKRVAA